MRNGFAIALALGCVLLAPAAMAQAAKPAAVPARPGNKQIEIFRIAPGQHEAFVREVARYDEANLQAGVPAREMYVHADGADWDFLFIKPTEYPAGAGEKMVAALKQMNAPLGERFFLQFRKLVASNTETFARGPDTAANFLARLDGKTPPSLGIKAPAPAKPAADAKLPPRPGKVLFEIYKVAPGQHENFLKQIAIYDAANERVGLPARQLYTHSDGADWDFLLLQPAENPADKDALLDKEMEKMNAPSAERYFVEFRKFIATHSDTFARGPDTAGDFVKRLDANTSGKMDATPAQ